MKNKLEVGEQYEGDIRIISSGHGFFKSSDYPDNDIFVHRSKTGHALHLDNVTVDLSVRDNKMEGTVVEITKRFKDQFVGRLDITEGKYAFLRPNNPKIHVDFYIPLHELGGAEHNQMVVVEMTKWMDNANNPNGKVIEILGNAGDNDGEIHSILAEYNLPHEFKKNVLDEANNISDEITQEEIDKRLDLRDVLTFTIDSADARDLDDSLSVSWHEGLVKITISIADVSHYVKPRTEIYKESYQRATSIYLIDRVIPMLPENLSNNLCSFSTESKTSCSCLAPVQTSFPLANNKITTLGTAIL